MSDAVDPIDRRANVFAGTGSLYGIHRLLLTVETTADRAWCPPGLGGHR
ncbi:MAG TPA: hypothetical protein VG455_06160 [Acidimicrobiales bacterium]|nr:hypothetical protein [Acidimicrobiales bacterium]